MGLSVAVGWAPGKALPSSTSRRSPAHPAAHGPVLHGPAPAPASDMRHGGVGHAVAAVRPAAGRPGEHRREHPPAESTSGPPELPGRTSPRSGVSRRETGPSP